MREWDLDECKHVEGSKVAHIERMRTLRKLTNDVGANFDDARFRTKLIDFFPESWDVICSICYSMTSLLEVILTLTSHGEQVLQTKTPATSSADTVKVLKASVLALQVEIRTLQSKGRITLNTNKSNLVCENKNCGKTGHSIDNYFQLREGKKGQYPPWWQGKHSAPPVSATANLATTADGEI